jgi:GGDEF domain-containing protein
MNCLGRGLWRRWRVAAVVRHTIALASEATGVPLVHRARLQLDGELARARRYQRPLTVGVVSLEADEPMGQAPHVFAAQPAFFLVGAVLRDAVRGSDLVTYDAPHDQYVILFTESTRLQTLQAAHRLQALVYTRTRLGMRIGLAEFPADGLTLEDLITMACSEAAKEAR